MWSGYAGLITAFVIYTSILLWVLIKTKTHIVIKLVLIIIGTWYSVALYYAPAALTGWPSTQQIPEMSIIRDGFVIEPKGSDPGAIYVWAVTYKENPFQTVTNPLNPSQTFQVLKPGIPRSYKLPYNKEQHKKITKKKKEKGKLLFYTKREGLKLRDPQEILVKESNE